MKNNCIMPAASVAVGLLAFSLGLGLGPGNTTATAAGVSLNDVLVDGSVPSITTGFSNDFPVRITYSETPFEAFLTLTGGPVDVAADNKAVFFKLDGDYWDWSFIVIGSRLNGPLGATGHDSVNVQGDVQHVVSPPGHNDAEEGQKASFSLDIDADDFDHNAFVSDAEDSTVEHPVPPFDGNTHHDIYSFSLFGRGTDGTFFDDFDEWAFSATADHVGAVPVPAALPLFLSGLFGLAFFGWRRKRAIG